MSKKFMHPEKETSAEFASLYPIIGMEETVPFTHKESLVCPAIRLLIVSQNTGFSDLP